MMTIEELKAHNDRLENDCVELSEWRLRTLEGLIDTRRRIAQHYIDAGDLAMSDMWVIRYGMALAAARKIDRENITGGEIPDGTLAPIVRMLSHLDAFR